MSEKGLSWVGLVENYDPSLAVENIGNGAIDDFLEHRPKVAVPFTDERKLRYLRHLATSGRKAESALVAGVRPRTVREHAQKDPDGFGAAVETAIDFFREVFIDRQAHKVAIEGWTEPVFYKGEKVGENWKFCPRTFELYAKKMDPSYRERVQQDVRVTGGILVIPQSSGSKAEWLDEANAVEAEHETLPE